MTSTNIIISTASLVILVSIYYCYLMKLKNKAYKKAYEKLLYENTLSHITRYMKLHVEYTNYIENEKIVIEGINQRLNVISKENNKLREKKELMEERLRNLGITDFDVI